jgi:hypothetical protein
MGHVYIPGLKVTEYEYVSKKRILPLKGEVIVKKGDVVFPDTVVALTHLPGPVEVKNIVGLLGVDAADLAAAMLKKEGETFKKGDILAQNKGFFGLFKTTVEAPFDGTLEKISDKTGTAVLRGEPVPLEIKAYVPGKITEIFEKEGVLVETLATLIQGIFGVGGEQYGVLKTVVKDNDATLDENSIDDTCKDLIVIGGGIVTVGAIRKAERIGVKGIIAGGLDAQDLAEYLGKDIGVAITGSENIPLTIVVTEGFGHIPMAQKTFDLLRKYEGSYASINGATQIRAGVIRPEVVIQQKNPPDEKTSLVKEMKGLEPGAIVRVIRVPYFGKIGKVSNLPPELRKLDSETHARVCEVEFPDGSKVIVPRANLEMIED